MAFNISTQPVLDRETFEKEFKTLDAKINSNSESLLAAVSELKTLHGMINEMSSSLSKIENKINRLNEAIKNTSASVSVKNITQPSGQTIEKKSPVTSKNEAPKPQKRIFYAKYSPTQEMLIELPDSMRDRASFVAEVIGDKGTVSFNPDCQRYALSALSSAIYPFFNYDLTSDSPTSITSKNTVPIERISGQQWNMKGKISLIIS